MALSADDYGRVEALFHQLDALDPAQRSQRLQVLRSEQPAIHAELVLLLAESRGVSDRERQLENWAQGARALGQREAEAPTRIGPYRIVRLLGEGGMGSVFEAEQDLPVHRRVALKLTRGSLQSAQVLARFDAERQALARLEHPNIARIFDAGTHADGRPWFAMEFVDGKPITHWADAGGLDLRQRIELLLPVCDAVQHAHQKGIIHRDLKPSNLLVTQQDGAAVPKVIDFGIAKAVSPDRSQADTTHAGELVGTPEYMSPEQATLGAVDVDTRSDVYALGLVLYELLVGELPLAAERLQLPFDELCRRLREDPPTRPSTRLAALAAGRSPAAPNAHWARHLRGDLDAVLSKALAPDRDQRYGSAALLADDLRRFLADQPVLATPPSWAYRAGKFVRRHRAGTAAAALMLLALLASGLVASLGWIEAREALRRAEQSQRSAEATSQFLRELFQAADPRENPGQNPDARELLARGIARIDGLDADPVLRASVLESLADVSLALGQLEQTESLLQQAIALRESGDAADPQRLAFLLDRRGALARERAQYSAAVADHRRALALLDTAGQRQTATYVDVLNNLGIALRRSGDSDAALAVYTESLALARAQDSAPSEGVATTLANLGAVHHDRRDYAAARASQTEALAMFQQLLPADHPNFAFLHSNLSLAARSAGELGPALRQIRQARANDELNLPVDHLERAGTLQNEAAVLMRLGELTAAEAALRQALTILSGALGAEHRRSAVARDSLAQVLRLRGEPAAAATQLSEIDRQLRADPSPPVQRHRISLLRQLAYALRSLGRLDEAEAAARESFALGETLDSRTDQALAGLLLALLQLDLDRDDAAAAAWQRALQLAPGCAAGACDLDQAASGVLRAHYLARRGEREAALQALQWALEHRSWSAQLLDSPDLGSLHDEPAWPRLRAALAARLDAARAAANAPVASPSP